MTHQPNAALNCATNVWLRGLMIVVEDHLTFSEVTSILFPMSLTEPATP